MRITLRFNIVTNFILIILLVTTLLLGLQYYSSNQIAQKAIDKTFKQVTNNTTMFIARTEAFLQKTLGILSLNNDISDALDINQTHPMLDDLAEALKNHKFAKGIYIGYQNGDFYEVLKLKKHPDMIKQHNPPKNSQ